VAPALDTHGPRRRTDAGPPLPGVHVHLERRRRGQTPHRRHRDTALNKHTPHPAALPAGQPHRERRHRPIPQPRRRHSVIVRSGRIPGRLGLVRGGCSLYGCERRRASTRPELRRHPLSERDRLLSLRLHRAEPRRGHEMGGCCSQNPGSGGCCPGTPGRETSELWVTLPRPTSVSRSFRGNPGWLARTRSSCRSGHGGSPIVRRVERRGTGRVLPRRLCGHAAGGAGCCWSR